MSFFKEWLKFLIAFLAPIAVILIGSTLVGFGVNSQNSTLLTIGLCTMGAGILWGIFQYHTHF